MGTLKQAWDVLRSKDTTKGIRNPGYPVQIFGGREFTWGTDGMQAYNNKIFYTATNILINKLLEPPIVFSKKREGATKRYTKFYAKSLSNEERFFIKNAALEEQPDHELKKLFDSPNDYQSGVEMMEDFWHNYSFGDGFLWFEMWDSSLSRSKKPKAIHSLTRSRIIPIQSTDPFNRILYYKYTTWNGQTVNIYPQDMLHLKKWNNNPQQMKGLGINEICAMDIALNDANNEAQGAAFVNGGRGTLFSSDTEKNMAGIPQDKMTAEQMRALKETMQKDFVGGHNNRRQHWTNGYVQAQNYGDTFAEMELTTSDESRWKYIFAINGVPWSLGPITTAATDNNVAAGYKGLVSNTCLPIFAKFDQKLTQKAQQWYPGLVGMTDTTEYAELAPDLKTMKEVFGTPFVTVDENRAVFKYDAIGGEVGKAILVPSGLMRIEDIVTPEEDVTDPNTDENL
jgi:hypothetical protein